MLSYHDDSLLTLAPALAQTLYPLSTVLLDIDIDVQLFSIVVWGTLRVQDRGPHSIVSLRATCINIKPGGKVGG